MDNLGTAQLDRRAERATGPRRIAVASGKGGVGKTWLAITLAQALARTRRRVLLVDGDFGLANIDIQLGLAPRNDLGAVLSNRVSMVEAMIDYAAGGFQVLPGRSGSGALSALPAARLDWLMEALASSPHDELLLDLGAGLEANTRRLSAWADVLLVVATDEPTSMTDAYAVLKVHAADRAGLGLGPGDTRVVINQATSQAAGQRTFATLARACQQFLGRAPLLAGVVRRDDRVRDAIRRQTPLLTRHPGSAAATDVERIAADLDGEFRCGPDRTGCALTESQSLLRNRHARLEG